MSDEAPPRFEHPMLQGYWTCKNPSCREQELQYLLTQTGGLCWKCFQNQPVVKRANELEVEMAGVVQRVSNRQFFGRRVMARGIRVYACQGVIHGFTSILLR